MKIVNLKIEELIPYINNPRNNENAIDKVASSIKEFGFKVPIVVDKEKVVVTGHTRLLASKKLGLEEVPCVIAEDLTKAQIKAFRIADNKVSEYSEWNEDLLKIELEELEEMDFNLDLLNIDYSDFDLYIGEDIETEEVEEVEILDVPVEPKAKLGDIYQLGNHRLMCGDSTSIDDVNKLMDNAKVTKVTFAMALKNVIQFPSDSNKLIPFALLIRNTTRNVSTGMAKVPNNFFPLLMFFLLNSKVNAYFNP